jgi:hypothetical protein
VCVTRDASVEVEVRKGAHPFAEAHYLNGNRKSVPLKNQSSSEVHSRLLFLASQCGNR